MGTHARLGPSNVRWPKCAGSVREEAAYEDIPGEAAIDGKGSHLLLELCIETDKRAEVFEGDLIGVNHPDKPSGWTVTQDRIIRVQECLDYIGRRREELLIDYPGCNITVESESKSDPGKMVGRSDWWGTCDITFTVTDDTQQKFVEVIDYKDGRIFVDSTDNTQLISYMGGKIKFHDENGHYVNPEIPCRMTIVQPKTNPSVRYSIQDSMKIIDEITTLKFAAKRTDDPDAPLVSGKWCKWCKHKKNCTEASEQSLKKVKAMSQGDTFQSDGSFFETMNETFGDITVMDSSKLEELADARPGIEEVFDRVDAEIQRRVEDPEDQTIKGYAMLPGRSKNQWSKDEEIIVKMLKARRLKKDDIFPSKLISPAQVLKLDILTNHQKDKITKKFIENVSGKSRLSKVRSEPVDKTDIFSDITKTEKPSFF